MDQEKKNTLSLCMIVKNEEDNLERCLESVREVVDEMVIVDTGSTDGTVAVAEKFGARVFHHPWQGSFSEARNHALGFAVGDWILQMDGDEELEREDIPILKKVVQSNLYNAINVALLNDSPEG
jgi:glycosyltransferase involved in cell wall biosynthesis